MASLAHAPAEALGGRPVAFLCRSCNRFLGTAYEAALTEAIRRSPDSETGRQQMTVKFGPTGGPLAYRSMILERGDFDPASVRLTLSQLGKRSEFVDDALRKSAKGRVLQFKGENDSVFRLAFLS